MKKLFSIILSIVMIVSVGALSATAYAAVGSQETTLPFENKIIKQVNGVESPDVKSEWVSHNPKQIKVTYTGDGTLKEWKFGDLEEGKDYKVVSRDGNTITIELLDDNYTGDIYANAIVDDAAEEEEEEEETKANTTTSQNGSSTSPKTGVAAAAGIAAMGAGAAILTALKKKED